MTASTAKPALRRRLMLATLAVFVLIGLAYAAWWLLVGAHYESTDDAYVHGDLVQVTPQISGTVVAIEAEDTETVASGQTLVRLDPADADIALRQAEARLAQAVRQVRTLYVQNDALQAEIDAQRAAVQRAQTDLARAETDLKRRQALAASGGVSGEELLHARTAVKAAQSDVALARAAQASAEAKLATNAALTRGTDIANHPDVRAAASALRQAWLDRSRTDLPAPVDGMVARRSVQVGQRVSPGTPLMTVVPLGQVWVEANFKEGQLRHMRVGQPATLVADMYGDDVTYHGRIAGLDAGTGSAFALLPAQNASGNWIKVVQRVPVRIALDPEELKAHPLRVGLSMEVEVDVDPDGEAAEPEPRTAPIWSTRAFEAAHDQADALIGKIISENLAG